VFIIINIIIVVTINEFKTYEIVTNGLEVTHIYNCPVINTLHEF